MEKFECYNCGCYYWVNSRDYFHCPNCEDNYIYERYTDITLKKQNN